MEYCCNEWNYTKACYHNGWNPKGLLRVSSCNELDNWRYYIAIASNQPIENNLEEYIVPSSMWAIFSGNGNSQSIQEHVSSSLKNKIEKILDNELKKSN